MWGLKAEVACRRAYKRAPAISDGFTGALTSTHPNEQNGWLRLPQLYIKALQPNNLDLIKDRKGPTCGLTWIVVYDRGRLIKKSSILCRLILHEWLDQGSPFVLGFAFLLLH
jgi:hypothetical protein